MRTLVLAVVCILTFGCHRQSVGTILEYELVMDDAPPGATADLERARRIVDGRINADRTRGKVTVEGDKLQIAVYGHDPQMVEFVDQRATPNALIEFLILADRRVTSLQPLIAVAEADRAENRVRVLDENGDVFGKWVW